MEPYENDGCDFTSAKIRRQEEILARVAVVEGDDISNFIDDVFMGGDEDEEMDDALYDVDNILLYKGDGEIGMECDVTRRRGASPKP